MDEWWTYRPSDFLMFAPRAWWRLLELHNAAWWPLQPAVLAAALGAAHWCWRQPGSSAWRFAFGGLAVAWAFTAWAFLWQRYAAINWAAAGFALAFAVQAAGLLGLACGRPGPAEAAWRRRAGFGLIGWALLGQPLLVLAFDRPWRQAELFALAPDPTVIATLGALLCTRAQGASAQCLRRALWAGALAACAVSAATLATMESVQAVVPAAAALLAVFSAWPRPAAPTR